MATKSKRYFVARQLLATTALAVICARPLPADAQEIVRSNLTPKKTYLKIGPGSSVDIDNHLQNVFTPTEIVCPGGGTCIVRIVVSAMVANLTGNLLATVSIDGMVVRQAITTGLRAALRCITTALPASPGWRPRLRLGLTS